MLNQLIYEADMTMTENGAATYRTTGSDCLDLFAAAGALRRADDEEIIIRFVRAYTEDPDIAMRILFYARDVRGGLGERRIFRTILRWLAENEPASAEKNLPLIAEYGRYDDLFVLIGTPCEAPVIRLVRAQLEKDLQALETDGEVSLLAKWMPSVNASSPETRRLAKHLARALGYDDAVYRRALTALRARIRIIENDLRRRDYTFAYEKQPSRALFKYKKAFMRNDRTRYQEFLAAVNAGTSQMHAGHVAPYELVEPYLTGAWFHTGTSFMKTITDEEKAVLNATWASLPDYGNDGNALAVIDTSGSMYWGGRPMPAAVALSLGLYFAEHNKGAFAGHFIEFSAQPTLIRLKGETFADRLRYAASFNEIANTNLEAVFDLILRTAVKNHLPQEELPSSLIIISDMEFDACVNHASETNYENARRKYAARGYTLPQIVFWNVASRGGHQPVRQNEQGAILVSGAEPRLFAMVAGGRNLSPYGFMMDILERERYAGITA